MSRRWRRWRVRRPPVRVHLFADDGTRDVLRRPVSCASCPMPPDHPVHQLPDVADAMAEHRRRAGDRTAEEGAA